ncbi:hypothetical protein LIER_05890 [Lithospermum erythrorhizon]|uniref:Uncharacterized protein n=1 Tax=Lithospermum erythrorhizon TaxID=34254 RepID=A0AAV3P352_LITER
MLITDEINTIKVLAIDSVAERILQTMTANISILSKQGQHYDVDTIRTELHGKVFLMLLRRTFGQQNQGQRKMLLSTFYDETDSARSTQSSILPCSSILDDQDAHTAWMIYLKLMMKAAIHGLDGCIQQN